MNFKLRPWRKSDLDSLVECANNVNIARFLTDRFPFPYTRENGEGFIEMATSGDPVNVFAIEINGKASGGIGVHPQGDIMCKNAELGYWVAEPFWGNGIISRAVPQMVTYGFENFDITRIYARPFSNNPASKRILEKCHFTLEAHIEKNIFKRGEFLDELIFAVRRDSFVPVEMDLIDLGV